MMSPAGIAITMAVWGANGPVEIGTDVTIHVGATSRNAESLADQAVRITDSAGKEVAGGALGKVTWPGTALLWSKVDVPVPPKPGLHAWEAHIGASTFAFSIAVVPVPAFTLRVIVTNETNAESTPLAGAYVRAGHYASTTDETGSAELAVSKGSYVVEAWKQSYGRVTTTAEVQSNVEISLATEVLSDKDPQYVREHWL